MTEACRYLFQGDDFIWDHQWAPDVQGGPDPSGSGYEMHFFTCDICTLMRELELYEFVPALCRLDYTMAETGGVNIPKKDMPKKNLKPIMLASLDNGKHTIE